MTSADALQTGSAEPAPETALDHAHSAMLAAPESEAARLNYYAQLADTEVFLLLESEAVGDTVTPQVFELESGPTVLIFDTGDRLAEFVGEPAPYAALPGRVIAGLLAGQGLGLGVNLGAERASVLLGADAVDWLVRTLQVAPEVAEASPVSMSPLQGLPDLLLHALGARLGRSTGMARVAYLCAVVYRDGRHGHLLGFVDVLPGAEAALAQAAAEALAFSGIDAGEMDVAFFAAQDAVARTLARVGLRFDIPQPEPAVERVPAAPGSDPTRPPILR